MILLEIILKQRARQKYVFNELRTNWSRCGYSTDINVKASCIILVDNLFTSTTKLLRLSKRMTSSSKKRETVTYDIKTIE